MDKKGNYRWGIIFSLIMGLMIIGLSFYFIFNELFSSDDQNMEVCRQSVQARAILPEQSLGGYNVVSFKDAYPLKCKTRVFDITKDDIVKDRAGGIIAERMAECWYLYDNGDTTAFPSKVFSSIGSTCVPCARIHLTQDAKNYLKSKPDEKINIRNSMDEKMEDVQYSYYTYLTLSGKKFSAFDLAGSSDFDFYQDAFEVRYDEKIGAIFHNRLNGGVDDGTIVDNINIVDVSLISLPEFFNPDRGDLLINYGIVTSSSKGDIGDYIPYLFYFQTGQPNNPFLEVQKKLVDGIAWKNANFCNDWEGIPG